MTLETFRSMNTFFAIRDKGSPLPTQPLSNSKAAYVPPYGGSLFCSRVSERTKAALAAAKARGVKLGNPNGTRALRSKQVGNKQALAAVKANAHHRAANLQNIVNDIRSQGITSVRAIAGELNARGILTPRGRSWHTTSATFLLARLAV